VASMGSVSGTVYVSFTSHRLFCDIWTFYWKAVHCIMFWGLHSMKRAFFWDIISCSALKINWPFLATYCHHSQDYRTSWSGNQYENRWYSRTLCVHSLLAHCAVLYHKRQYTAVHCSKFTDTVPHCFLSIGTTVVWFLIIKLGRQGYHSVSL
jgi:hypothetical protein